MKTIPICSVFVLNDKNEVLSVRQKYERMNGYAWTLPGGGVDDGETSEIAAAREVMEETGLRVLGEPELVYDVRCIEPNVIIHVHGYLYRTYEGTPTISEEDVAEIAFLPIPQARELMAMIDDESRVDPIVHVLDHLHATGKSECFRCEYMLDEHRNIRERKVA